MGQHARRRRRWGRAVRRNAVAGEDSRQDSVSRQTAMLAWLSALTSLYDPSLSTQMRVGSVDEVAFATPVEPSSKVSLHRAVLSRIVETGLIDHVPKPLRER